VARLGCVKVGSLETPHVPATMPRAAGVALKLGLDFGTTTAGGHPWNQKGIHPWNASEGILGTKTGDILGTKTTNALRTKTGLLWR
jgi:hypothetical protein